MNDFPKRQLAGILCPEFGIECPKIGRGASALAPSSSKLSDFKENAVIVDSLEKAVNYRKPWWRHISGLRLGARWAAPRVSGSPGWWRAVSAKHFPGARC